jgi:hypothetical protein
MAYEDEHFGFLRKRGYIALQSLCPHDIVYLLVQGKLGLVHGSHGSPFDQHPGAVNVVQLDGQEIAQHTFGKLAA